MGALFPGFWFLGWTFWDGHSGQLQNLQTHFPIQTSAGAGIWVMGLGAATVALGGLMMRFPTKALLITGAAIPDGEKALMASKDCPQCAETVKGGAQVCRFCGFKFEMT